MTFKIDTWHDGSCQVKFEAQGHTSHIPTTVLRPSWILSATTRVSWHQKGNFKTKKVKPIWIYWSKT